MEICNEVMEKSFNKLKILNIISGSEYGGAESFFERFSIAINKDNDLIQKVLIRNNKKRLSLFKRNNIDVETLSFNKFFDFVTKRKINETFYSFNPNIVLCWMNRASSMLPKMKDKSIVTIGRLGGFYKIKNYVNCDYLIANTPEIKKYILSMGWPKKNVVYLPNFVKCNSRKTIKKSIHYTPDEFKVILALGRFHQNKGFDQIIRSLEKLPNHFLWLVGDGALKNYYVNLAKQIGVNNRLRIINWTDDVSSFYKVADVLVCSSNIEPLGNIIIEGWAHKIPVISSDIMGPKKLIKNLFNGLKYKKNNISQLINCINKVHKNVSLKKEIINNAYKDYLSNYSEEVVVKKFKEFFYKVSK